jgi:16S rRNA processing protein RimM
MVIMGRVAAAYGIRGWVKIQPYTETVESLMGFRSWWLGKEGGPWREVEVKHCEVRGKALAAELPDSPDRNAAERLRGLLVAVPRASLPRQNSDEFYWSDLVGLAVVNVDKVQLGTVSHLVETGANQVLSVTGDMGEILIPFVASAIKSVDLKKGIILVDWSADY